MTSYSQQYKDSQLQENFERPSRSENSFSDIYLQEVRKPEDIPKPVSASKEAVSSTRPEVKASSEEEGRKRAEPCPKHLQLHKNILQQAPRSEIRLPASEEQKLKQNISELSLVEGNLLGRKGKVRSLYITSCFNGEGKTAAAVSTAYALSSLSGRQVLLMDGNNTSPRLHSFFGVKQAPGLSDCLKKDVALSSICVPTAYNGLFLVPSGTSLNHDLSFFSDQVGQILREAETVFDYIVWDGASVLQGSQASALATFFDGMTVVVECEKTKWEVVQMAREKIENSGGEIAGVVMNKRKFYIPRVIYKMLSKR